MLISDNWKHFVHQFNKLVDRRKGQLELDFKDLEPQEEEKKSEKKSNFDLLLSGLLLTPPPKKDK